MAVLCEAISVIIRAERAIAVFGSFDDFKRVVPNSTLAADDELIRIGFMAPDDVKSFIDSLEGAGLEYIRAANAVDLVVVDQLRGPLAACDWVEFGKVSIEGGAISAARLKGSSLQQVVTPPGWEFEGSLSQTFGFVANENEGKAMTFVRRERGMDVYFSPQTNREVLVGRTETDAD